MASWQYNISSLTAKDPNNAPFNPDTPIRQEYLVEGNLPFPVVMFLPMIQTATKLFDKYDKLEKVRLY
jgi:hypothetical protein